ncbi:hypothetical protein J6590_018322 [Homalodisca vitripennis]|nr:hypothetical protein J6590_018322 [Homalodisca vitripennis]
MLKISAYFGEGKNEFLKVCAEKCIEINFIRKGGTNSGAANKRGGRGDSESWNNRPAPPATQNKWGGNGYGANPWDAPGDNQVWSGPSQQWGMNQNQEGNYGHGWGAQENFAGGPMRNNMYSGRTRRTTSTSSSNHPALDIMLTELMTAERTSQSSQLYLPSTKK